MIPGSTVDSNERYLVWHNSACCFTLSGKYTRVDSAVPDDSNVRHICKCMTNEAIANAELRLRIPFPLSNAAMSSKGPIYHSCLRHLSEIACCRIELVVPLLIPCRSM